MNTELPIYLIPGLGADYRVFAGLKDQGLQFEVLDFVDPDPKEPLADYSLRLAQQIDTSKPFVLGGMSLGGMMATEIAKVHPPEKLLLISSVPTSGEIPFYLRASRYIPVHRLFKGTHIKKYFPRSKPKDEQILALLRAQREDADPFFLEWAIRAVLKWRNREIPPDMVRLHGTRDILFPGFLCGPRIKISKGKHVMVLVQAEEVYQLIAEELEMVEQNFVS